MYTEEIEETSLESCALAQASKHLEQVYELGFDGVMQERHIVMAYLALLVAGKQYEAKLVGKMARLEDEAERSLLALWVLGARLELPGYKDQWQEQARDSWCLMVVGSALQNIELMEG